MILLNKPSHYPIAALEDHIMFASNGNIIACFKIQLPEIYSLSENDFEDLHGLWFQAFKNLPSGCVVHKQDLYQKTAFSSDTIAKDSYLSRATANYFEGRKYLKHSSYLFFILTTNKSFNNAGFQNPFKKASSKIPEKSDRTLNQFIEAVNDSVAFINNAKKLEVIPLSSSRIKKLTSLYFNGFKEGIDTDILLDSDKVQIGNQHFELMAVNNENCFGEQLQSSKANEHFTADDFSFQQGFMDGLGLNINADHLVNQIIYLDDKPKWRKLIDGQIEQLKKSSNFGSANKENLKKLQALRTQIQEDDSARIVRGQLNILFWDTDPEALKQTGAKIQSEFKELDIRPYYPKGRSLRNYLLKSYFGYSSQFSNNDLYVGDLKHALCLWINNTNYSSDEKGILFNDRQHNIPVKKDLWDEKKKRIKARNFAIFAPTGEGKSFLANNILRQYFEAGVRLVIIDLGGSYSKFAKLYPGSYSILRYERGMSLGINPFYLQHPEDFTPDRLEDLAVFLIELYATETPVPRAEAVALKKMLQAYYKDQTQEHSLQGFYDFIASQKEYLQHSLGISEEYFDLSGFLHVLSEYVDEGIYSFLFKSTKDEAYKLADKKLIVFELDEVRNNKELLSVMLKLIKSAISQTIWKNRAERGIILFDEFAKQLKFDNVLESVEFYYQAIRKQNGAIGIVLQSINQLPKNETSASILENTQIIYSLRNEKGYDELVKRLKLSDHDLNQLKSIQNNLSGPKKYTEIFIKVGRSSNIYRLEVPPEVYAAYLTDGSENEKLMRLYEKYGTMETAIEQFLLNH